MKEKLLGLLLPVMFAIVFNACQGDSRKDLLLGKWSYLEFQMNDQKMSGDELEDPTMQFSSDGSYKITFGEMSEDGKWKLDQDQLIMDSETLKKENTLLIVELSEDKLVLEGEAEGNKITITLEPQTAGTEK